MPRFLLAAVLITAGCAANGQGSAPTSITPSILSASPSSQAAPLTEGEDLRRRLGTTDVGVALTAGAAGTGGTPQVAVTVRNRGPNPVTGVLVSITVAGVTDIGALSAGCRGPTDATIVCDVGEIPS